MTILHFVLVVFSGSMIAGLLGSLTGLGGGVVIVPMLTLMLGVDLRYAIGASLISVIATSSGAASAYVREGFTNIRIGMFLELATTIGAICGAFLASVLNPNTIGLIFGVVLIFSAVFSLKGKGDAAVSTHAVCPWPRLQLQGSYPGPDKKPVYYAASRPAFGFGLMGVAGVLSGLLGIGSGAVKVLAMDQCMKLPFKVSTTTSNFMIGVTAAASAGVYLRKGYIDPVLSMPVMLGVLAGALLGAKLLVRAKTKALRWLFAGVVGVMAVQMIAKSLAGKM
ncbi:MAG: sulfite exporter TauE/SafE family protein [Acidobacteria bacterium]|nr:sulfite exporter TauE/SafE family protein [Acidobacteriota bacterium]